MKVEWIYYAPYHDGSLFHYPRWVLMVDGEAVGAVYAAVGTVYENYLDAMPYFIADIVSEYHHCETLLEGMDLIQNYRITRILRPGSLDGIKENEYANDEE